MTHLIDIIVLTIIIGIIKLKKLQSLIYSMMLYLLFFLIHTQLIVLTYHTNFLKEKKIFI